jgi:pilus assembly protein FimV
MSGLSLDLGQTQASETGASDSMVTKLALAREFLAIGDNEGARVMAQDVAQKASGELKAQAEALLASIL